MKAKEHSFYKDVDKQLADLQIPAVAALGFLAQATVVGKVNLLEFINPYTSWPSCWKAWQLLRVWLLLNMNIPATSAFIQ